MLLLWGTTSGDRGRSGRQGDKKLALKMKVSLELSLIIKNVKGNVDA